jgi:phosphatidate cytidylyltransferase
VLKTRILTALVIFPVTVAVVFLAPPWMFQLVLALLLIVASWEFRGLAGLSGARAWILPGLQTLLIGTMAWRWPQISEQVAVPLAIACAVWVILFLGLTRYEGQQPVDSRYQRRTFLYALATVTFCWFALAWLRDQPQGTMIVFMLLLLIWASDVGAYFSGRALGRNKLAPLISPGKTREGVYGGIVLALAAAFLWAWGIADLPLTATALIAMSVVTSLSSVGGDLFISVHKRTVGLKDTGAIFPGHGGVLDRYDSLLAGAPFFALAYRLLG